MEMRNCTQDHFFGPIVHGCRDNFDFTKNFERIFFALVPDAIFISICLIRIAFLLRRPRIVDGTVLLCVKLVSFDSIATAAAAPDSRSLDRRSRLRYTSSLVTHCEELSAQIERSLCIFYSSDILVRSLHRCPVILGALSVSATINMVEHLLVSHSALRHLADQNDVDCIQ
jgi:hypothetical protein